MATSSRPQYGFRPRGQSGKMISDLFPHLGSLVDDLCFIHSMTAKSNTHGPAENQMSTGFTLDGFPSMGSWASYALGSRRTTSPRSWRSLTRAGAAGGGKQLVQRLPSRGFSRDPVQRPEADLQPRVVVGRPLARDRVSRRAICSNG